MTYPVIHRDYETRSTCDLKAGGAHAYAEHPSTEILCAVWIVERADNSLSEPFIWYCGDIPESIRDLIEGGCTVAGHNAAFEQCIDTYLAGPRLGWPLVRPEQLDCTMARCAVQAVPLDLDRACKALAVPHQKDKEGHRLMLRMCKPRKAKKGEPATVDCRVCSGVGCAGRRPEDAYEGPHCVTCDGTGEEPAVYWHFDESMLLRLTEYCVQDVRAEIALDHALRPLQDQERPVWLLDQTMNNRGVQIDLDFINRAEAFAIRAAARADRRMAAVTGGAVTKTTQIKRLKDFAKAHGVEFKLIEKTRRNGEKYEAEAADKEALQDLLEAVQQDELDEDAPDTSALNTLPQPVKEAFEIRLEAGKSSLKKFAKFKSQAPQGRARGNLQYHAAAPGRWAGRGIQLQNLRRQGINEEGGWEQAYRDMCDLDDEAFETVWGSPFDVLSRMTRGAVIAAPGKRLYWADYSSVEARGAVWAACQQDKVDLFARDGKIYEETAAQIFGIPVEDVNKDQRFLGKGTVLGCGYGMGALKFQATCKKQGRPIPFDLALTAVGGWREANPNVVDYWRELEDAARHAIEAPDKIFTVGPFSYRVKGKWLQCRLPSGRLLWYRRPSLKWVESANGRKSLKIHYWGVNGVTKQWEQETTWGGKLLENCDQGMCSDFLRAGMLRLEAADYPMVLSVHDEAIAETNLDFGSVTEFVSLYSQVPHWAAGFPLKAEGGTGLRYAKA